MKKTISAFLAIVLLLSLFSSALAVDVVSNGKTINYDLTCQGKAGHSVTVLSGDTITVEYRLENKSSSDNFTIMSLTNEVYYDTDFFEIVEIRAAGHTLSAKENVYTTGEHRVYFNSSHLNRTEYESGELLGTIKLKVKATSGSSTLVQKALTAYDNDLKTYVLESDNLTVTIGEPQQDFLLKYVSNGVTSSSRVSGLIKIAAAPDNIPQGKQFKGWRLDVDGQIYQSNADYTVTRDVTFTAVFEDIPEREQFTLTFDTNGGSLSSVTDNKLTRLEGTVIDLSEYVPVKNGYNFKGWYADPATTRPVTSIELTADTTIYARWERQESGGSSAAFYTLSFETNGGTPISPVSKPAFTEVDLSKYVTTREGYSFDGWYADKALSSKITGKLKISRNTTIYAKWVEGDNGYEAQPNYRPDIFAEEHYSYITGRDGGYFCPNAKLTRAEAATMFFRLLDSEVRTEVMTSSNKFRDVNPGDWFNTAVSTLANLGVINGRTEDTFEPNAKITRAELTTIIARLSEASYEGKNLFSDISGHWAKDNINIAASIGWVEGDNGSFRPDDGITRAEVVTLINRALGRQPETADDLLPGMITPPDNTNTKAWYYLAVQEAVNSHTFTRKADGTYEKWATLVENPDWDNFEG